MIFKFHVKWYCEDEEAIIDDYGITAGDNLAGATAKLVEYYGEDSIEELQLKCVENTLYGIILTPQSYFEADD